MAFEELILLQEPMADVAEDDDRIVHILASLETQHKPCASPPDHQEYGLHSLFIVA